MSAETKSGGSGIVRQLSRRLFFRLLWIFITLDITLCVITAAAAVWYCETRVGEVARGIESGGMTENGAASTITVSSPPGNSNEFYTVRFYPGDYLSRAASGVATLREREIEHSPYRNAIGTRVYYNAYYESSDGAMHRISISLTDFIIACVYGFGALALWEFLTLIGKSIKNTRMLRRALEPITELARAAETLGRAREQRVAPRRAPAPSGDDGAVLDKNDITELSGALDLINASRLDTRIDVDGTQQELRELAAAINGMLERVNEAYLAQVRFVSDASHELRTPIAVIQGYANLLDRWGKNDEKTLQESIDAIRAEADSMKALVEQLLFLARGENNTIQLEISDFDLAELAEELAQETRLIDTAREFRVLAESAPVSADRQLIKQAARILIDNAIKYTDPGGLITLRATLGDARAVFSVTDTGVGISEDLLPKIFDRFVRTDESRARSSGGAGLGLAIAKWIVSRHGGHMEALSRVGAGTRITISLPARGGETAGE
ncbi:MAG: HAMP domain-containing histidine kinase [Oscillospiraceae bacterium]|jgi:signal transduction histidine kinase|nr:HAMP domain-containing histidine kinase [Oscillospiraceae bacterium]